MGYRVDTSVTLVLDGMAGAEVSVCIGVPLSALMEYDAATGWSEGWSVFMRYAKPTWNLEDAAGPIPVDEDSINRVSFPVIRAVMNEWRKAAVNPPAPLPPPSSDGEPSAT